MEPKPPAGRRTIRLEGYDYTLCGGYFVTLVAQNRACLFGEVVEGEMHVNALGRIVQECWDAIPVHFPHVTVDEFVIMPNHVHGIVIIHDSPVGATHASPLPESYASPPPKSHASPLPQSHAPPQRRPHGAASGSLGAIVGSFKSAVTRRAGRELDSANPWQRNYYEHIIRDQPDYERIAAYIFTNPANWETDEENRAFRPAGQEGTAS